MGIWLILLRIRLEFQVSILPCLEQVVEYNTMQHDTTYTTQHDACRIRTWLHNINSWLLPEAECANVWNADLLMRLSSISLNVQCHQLLPVRSRMQ